MRTTLMATVAAAALSLNVAAMAQTSGSGSTSGGAAGGSSGSSTIMTTPGASGSGSSMSGSGNASGAASGTTQGSASGSTSTSPGKAGSAAQNAQPGTAKGTASGSGTMSTTGKAPGKAGTAETTGSTTSGGSINVTSEQRTQLSQSFRSVNVQPLNSVNFSISVGSTVPASVTTLYDCPDNVERILTGLPACKYIVVRDQVVIVEPSSRRIVTVIERRG
ncbi:hypothetical protein GGR34_000034 [Microvirga flocculans]|uniref:DUF1236 domain-containing protein n=1 Tax=Microvirga flocculans TaxID=217168 RepID=A0A7W6IBK5_9HYPH|nr:DUF1236 domain-containing protein [Microvirga flocculans]MBB4038405.1 hypothetical protein [Microvirga flocculans]